jgi:CBS-domain-containing membrane protein
VSVLLRHRTVGDVMTARVHVASPLTPFKLLVRLIEENRISAIPIVDTRGVPVGVVSESDLLLKEWRGELEADTGPLHGWKNRLERAKAGAVLAQDLMTSPAITVAATALITDAARLMHERNVRRLVVIDQRGRIAGIVSRSDLLQVFLRTDEDLREEVVERIIPAILPTDGDNVVVDVRSNVITLSGEVDRRSDSEILTRMSREVDGVVDVVNLLRFRWDDLRQHAGAI